ncbi:MAG: glycosyltransferase family 39 protein [Vicinamibacteria bacterium]|nr:glycosyltransferase family 39 protein [Vicinamibacteria bacterium]
MPDAHRASSTVMPLRQASTRGQLLMVGAVVALLTVPFATRAVHLDDVYFLEVAANVLRDPWQPFAGAVALEDIDYRVFARTGKCPTTFASMSHPPLVSYVMALVAWLAGGFRELPLHLAFDLFALVAAFAMYDLARRFTPRPLVTTLLLVSSPVFAISAQGLMTDMPALALSLTALAVFIRGSDRRLGPTILLSGVLAGLAIMTRYSAFLLLPLFCAYALVQGRARRAWPALAGAAMVLGLWAAQNMAVHGQLHIVASARHYRLFFAEGGLDWVGFVKKTLGDLSGLGGTSFVAAGLLLATGLRRRATTFGLSMLAAALVFVVRPAGIERLDLYTTLEITTVALSFAGGALLLVEGLWPVSEAAPPGAEAERDGLFLAAWLLLAIGVALFLLPFGTARYMLSVLPPLWILLVRRFGSRESGPPRVRAAAGLVIAQGVVLSLVLGAVDQEYAGSYRDFSVRIRESYPRRNVWFVGEWGFRYYMSQAHGKYLRSTDDGPQPGDIIVRPFNAGMHEISPSLRSRSALVEQRQMPSRWPIRLMNFEAKAGYYSHHWGYLPWAVSDAPLETVDVFEVRSPAPPAEPVPCASS